MAQKTEGSIVSWKQDKGFGFIKVASGEDIFFHISEYNKHQSNPHKANVHHPKVGELVSFTPTQDEQGRIKAIQVLPLSIAKSSQQHNQQEHRAKSQTKRSSRHTDRNNFKQARQKEHIIKVSIAVAFYALLGIIVWLGYLNKVVLGWYVLVSIITFLIYAKDKSAARNNRWRTPESNLHLLSLLGGWVGAMLAQTYLRHKSKKMPFRAVYYLTIAINLAALIYVTFFADLVDVNSLSNSISNFISAIV